MHACVLICVCFCMCACVCVCRNAMCVQCQQKPEEGVGALVLELQVDVSLLS